MVNRKRRVNDLHQAVESISDADAFQLVIVEETDDYVLADLRDRFWDGTGEKPWQVKEINRLLTARQREARDERGGEHRDVQVARITARQAIGVALITALAGLAGALIASATQSSPVTALTPQQHWLTILELDTDFGVEGTGYRVIAEVNGQAYSYPSRVPWAESSPSMSTERFPLPAGAEEFAVRFEVLTNLGDGETSRSISQEIHRIPVAALPLEREYSVYGISGSTRSGEASMRVRYELR